MAALHRLLDMGIESFLIASSVVAVVGQRLVRRICPTCQVDYTPTAEELAFYEESGGQPKKRFVHGEGCSFCADTGYQDRIGVYELLRVTPEIKRLVVGLGHPGGAPPHGGVAGDAHPPAGGASSLVEQDVTTIAEVIRSIYTALRNTMPKFTYTAIDADGPRVDRRRTRPRPLAAARSLLADQGPPPRAGARRSAASCSSRSPRRS